MKEHNWIHKPGLFGEAEIPRGVQVEREPAATSSGVFQERFCLVHPGERLVQEIPITVFD
ncbi:MAG TPA: hypothetical protein VNK70_00940 [Candidatus Paceibacterota bacterium]|nr:hypothetical protein [Candidatus Paceibacterota bacterium]